MNNQKIVLDKAKYDTARKIYLKMFGTPKTHIEWSSHFKKVYDIVELLKHNEL